MMFPHRLPTTVSQAGSEAREKMNVINIEITEEMEQEAGSSSSSSSSSDDSSDAGGHQVFPRTMAQLTDNGKDGDGQANGFSVVTYNILTDHCMPLDEYLYCPEDVRYMASRHRHILAEVQAMQPDILCLQEADKETFYKRLLPDLTRQGYSAVYQRVADQGMAVCYKRDEFELLEHRHCVLHHLAERYIQNADISETIRENIRECIARPIASVMVRLRHLTTGQPLALANIHVSWEKLKYPAMQALQISCATNELVDFAGGPDKTHIICGDFNTPPSFPAYHMLTDGEMRESTQETLRKMTSHSRLSDILAAQDLVRYLPDAFKLKTDLKSAYKMVLGEEPAVTSCDDCGLAERMELCLDYVWFSNRSLEVTGVLRTPPSEAICRFYALPSVLFPSDHIPLKATFAFR